MSLSRLFAPRAIAVIGASPDPNKLPGRPLSYLKRFGFMGDVYAVNPKYDRVGAYPCVATVEDLPPGVDLALILLPASGVAATLEACGRKKIAFAISIASGFAEAGGLDQQQELVSICARTGIRLVGPNCVGLLAPEGGVTATFSTELGRAMPRAGKFAIATQSGALGNALLQAVNAFGLGLRAWVSTGNEADLGVLDFLEHFIADDEAEVIALFVEGLRDGERLMALARQARAKGKAIVVLRAGRSDAGRQASASHTGKLAGSARVWSGVVRQAGILEVGSLEEMVDLLRAFETLGMPRPEEKTALGVLSVSGGLGVVIADCAASHGLPLARFEEATVRDLRALLPPQMSVANPVDTALFASADGYARCAELVLRDSNVGALVMVFSSLSHSYDELEPWLRSLGEEARRLGKIVAATYLSATDQFDLQQQCELGRAGVLLPPSAERTVQSLARRAATRTAPIVALEPIKLRAGENILARAGVSEPRQNICATLDDAQAFARKVGYPVALKVSSPDLPHKTEVGGVALDLDDDEALACAWTRMVASVQKLAPDAQITGYQVQQMATGGVELIVGCSRDPEFGPVLMIGWGGVYAEAIEDVAFLALPASRVEIAHALGGLRVSKLLDGARGAAPADRDAVIVAVQRLAAVFIADDYAELDVNPLLARERGVLAVDILTVPLTTDHSQGV